MSNISKSIDKIVKTKKLDYEKEKNDFSKFLVDEILPSLDTKNKDFTFFTV